MLIHSGIITLNYNPATDILETTMPDIRHLSLSEVRYCLSLIGDSIRSYDIKYFLLDASKSVLEIEDGAYKEMMHKFGLDLAHTRLKKVARVSTNDVVREERASTLSVEIRQKLNFAYDFKNFNTSAEALEWLREQDD